MVILIAIDPSTRETGWAIFSKEKSVRPNKTLMPGEVPSPRSPIHLGQSDRHHTQWEILETGSILAHHRPQRVEVTARIKAIEAELDRMAARWQPKEVACGKPSLMQLPNQREGSEMLSRSLELWAQGHSLPIYSYPLRQIRAAILGRANPREGGVGLRRHDPVGTTGGGEEHPRMERHRRRGLPPQSTRV